MTLVLSPNLKPNLFSFMSHIIWPHLIKIGRREEHEPYLIVRRVLLPYHIEISYIILIWNKSKLINMVWSNLIYGRRWAICHASMTLGSGEQNDLNRIGMKNKNNEQNKRLYLSSLLWWQSSVRSQFFGEENMGAISIRQREPHEKMKKTILTTKSETKKCL